MSLAKEAAEKTAFSLGGASRPPSEQEKRQRKEYYLRNRERLLRESRQWKLEHAAQQKKYRKRYARQVKAGARVPKGRVKAGIGYAFVGPKNTALHSMSESPNQLSMHREKRD